MPPRKKPPFYDVAAMLAVTVAGVCYVVTIGGGTLPICTIAGLGFLVIFGTIGSKKI